jgi:2OG-Fe(II) oxygenase superfamily/ShK domain-like
MTMMDAKATVGRRHLQSFVSVSVVSTMKFISNIAWSLLLCCLLLAQLTKSQEEEQCEDGENDQRIAQDDQDQQQQEDYDGYQPQHYDAFEQLLLDETQVLTEHDEQLIHDAKVKFNNDAYPCYDEIKTNNCPNLAKHNGCIKNFAMMRQKCRKTCLLCITFNADEMTNIYSLYPQKTEGPFANEIRRRILESDRYMYHTVYVDEQYAAIRAECQNRDELCSFWAQSGECQANERFMHRECAPACFSCHDLHLDLRCPYNPNNNDPSTIFTAGSVNAMFTRIVTDPVFRERYHPVIYSQPQNSNPEDNNSTKSGKEAPWVVVLDDFLSASECQALIELGAVQGYELSMDVGERNFDGSYQAAQSDQRTSTNAWCTDTCWQHDVTQTVHGYMEHVTGVPRINYEYLQILRYEVGQFYGTHHDFVPHHSDRSCGPRILTVFLYLNDVEEGGGTNFPLLQTVRLCCLHNSILLVATYLTLPPSRLLLLLLVE